MSGTICKALKIRIYPTPKQETLILKTLGSCRFIYNHMLAEHIEVYERLKEDRRSLYEYKYKTEKEYKAEYDWLYEVDSIALQQSRIDLSKAYQNFFKSCTGKRKGSMGFPKFHKKGKKETYRTVVTGSNIAIDFEARKVKLPKLGWIPFRDQRCSMKGKLKQATVSRTATGKYFVSLFFEQEFELKGVDIAPDLKIKGLDCSMSNFYIDDEGNSPAYEAIYRKEAKKLARRQRQFFKKQKGSKNQVKARLQAALVHERIANKRKDFTHKLSTSIMRDYDVIVVENLNLKAMAQGLNLGKSVNDLGYGAFLQQLQYKALWNNKTVIEADKWFASSKTCSKCGFVYKDLTLSDRVFNCPSCGFEIDRDHNAGINLKNYGSKELGLGQPDFKPVEKTTAVSGASQDQVVSVKQEASKSLASR